jgi:hypothetical protein
LPPARIGLSVAGRPFRRAAHLAHSRPGRPAPRPVCTAGHNDKRVVAALSSSGLAMDRSAVGILSSRQMTRPSSPRARTAPRPSP